MSTLSLPVRLAFGIGQLAEAVKNQGFNVFLLFFYNQVLGVSASLTGLALAMALVVDAISDPLVGSYSDKLRTRYGRRHPLMALAAVPMALCFYLLFNPPEGLTDIAYFCWLLLFAVAVRLSLTFYHIPHLALGAELAEGYQERSALYAASTFFGFLGGALFVPLSYRLFFPTTETFNPGLLNADAYAAWSLFSAIIIVSAIWICAAGTLSQLPRLLAKSYAPAPSVSPKQVIREFSAAFSNRSFKAIFFGMMLSTFILAVESIFNPFMGFHFWGMTTEQLSIIPLVQLGGLFASLVVLEPLTRWFEKKWLLVGSAVLVIININTPIVLALVDVSWLPERGSNALLAVLVVSGFLTAFLGPMIFATVNSMFADITDEHELETGHRREGVIFAVRGFAVKVNSSLGIVLGGFLLDFIQFPRDAKMGEVESDIVWQLGLIAGPATSVFSTIGVLCYLFYRIDRKRHAAITAALGERQAAMSGSGEGSSPSESAMR